MQMASAVIQKWKVAMNTVDTDFMLFQRNSACLPLPPGKCKSSSCFSAFYCTHHSVLWFYSNRISCTNLFAFCSTYSLQYLLLILCTCSKCRKSRKERWSRRELNPGASGIPCHCSATKLQLPPETTPHSCPNVACSSILLIGLISLDLD